MRRAALGLLACVLLGGCGHREPTAVGQPGIRADAGLFSLGATLHVGQHLAVSNGYWSFAPTSYGYQWKRCTTASESSCSSITSGIRQGYTVQAADEGDYLRATVTAHYAGGEASAASGNAGPVEGGGGGTCAVELSSLTNVNADLKTAGETVCLTEGTYTGPLELTADPSATSTLTAAAGAHVVIEGSPALKLKPEEAAKLKVTQIHFKGAIEPWKTNHDKFEYDEVIQKSAGEDGFYCWDCKQVEWRHGIIRKFESASGDGDLTHFKEEIEEDVVAESEFTEAWDISGSAGHMDTLQTEGKAGVKAGKLTFSKNYVHDINTQGTPFTQQENTEVNGEELITDNLVVRNNEHACEGTGKTCNSFAGVSFYIHDKYNPVIAENNVELETNGGAIEEDIGEPVTFSKNIFDLIKRNKGEEGNHTTAEYNYILSFGGYSWPGTGGTEIGYQGSTLPEFECETHCGEGHTKAHDAYRIKGTNTHSIGINWVPTEMTYGPTN